MDKKQEQTPEQRQILQIYAAFGASMVLSLLPFMNAALLSLALGVAVLIYAYVLRKKHDQASLVENHMTYIIRTIWIGSFIALIVMIFGAIYLYVYLDNRPLNGCVDQILAAGEAILDINVLLEAISPCSEMYIQTNIKTIMISAGMIIFPTIAYFTIRYMRGLMRAIKGHRVSDPNQWF